MSAKTTPARGTSAGSRGFGVNLPAEGSSEESRKGEWKLIEQIVQQIGEENIKKADLEIKTGGGKKEIRIEVRQASAESSQGTKIRFKTSSKETGENKPPRPSEVRGFLKSETEKTAKELLEEGRAKDAERENRLLRDR